MKRSPSLLFGVAFSSVLLDQWTKHWATFVEYKGNYSFVNDVPIDSGDTLKTKIFTNALNFGVSFNF